MKLFRYEFQKLFQNRVFLIFAVALLIANIALTFYTAPKTRDLNKALAECFEDYNVDASYFEQAYHEYYTAKEHALDMQMQAAMEGKDPTEYRFDEPSTLYPESGYTDEIFYTALFSDRQNAYNQKVQEILQETDINLKTIVDPYMRSYLSQVKDIYSKQAFLSISNVFTAGWNEFFGYHGTAVWLLFLVFVASAILSTCDQTSRSELIIFTTELGAKYILTCKLLVLLFVCFVSTMAFEFSSFAVYHFSTGLYGANAFLVTLDSFSLCPYPIYVYEFLLLRFAFLFLTLFMTGLFWLLTVRLLRNLYASISSFIGLFAVQVFTASSKSVSNGSSWHSVHLFGMMDASAVCKKYSTVNFVGCSVPLVYVFLILWIGICTLLVGLLYVLWNRYRVPKAQKRSTKTRRRIFYSLTAFEFKKQFCRPLVILMIIFVLFFKVVYAFPQEDLPYREKLYRNYMQTVQEMSDTRAQEYISIEKQRFEELFKKAEDAHLAYQHKKMSYAEYSRISIESRSVQIQYEVLLEVAAEIEYVAEMNQQGLHAKVIYQTGWKELLLDGTHILWLLLLLLPSLAYSKGEKTEFRYLLHSCPNGRRVVFLNKLMINSVVMVTLTLIMTGVEIAGVGYRYTLPHTEASISSISPFSHMGDSLSLGNALLLIIVARLIAVIAVACIGTSISAIFRQPLSSVVLHGALLFLPYALSLWENKITNYFSIVSLFCFDTLTDLYMLPLAFALFAMALILSLHVCKTE